ncbi:uncharacterized protein Fs isoform X2 [Drosophila tropicalis]
MLTMRALPVPTTTEARTPNQLAATLSKTSAAEAASASATATAAAAAPSPATSTTNSSHKCRTILSLFIAIAWNIVQESANCLLQQAGRIDRVAIPDDAGHDVNTAPLRHRCTRIAGTADDANDKVSTAREQPQPQQQQQLGNDYLASSSQPCTRTTSGPGHQQQQHHQLQLHSGQPLMTLLIGLLLLNISLAAAGTCWQTHLGSGKCNQIFSTNITKTECCGASQTFSYTDRELSSVEYFFATAIGGGVECAPCMENCKSFKCGPNKKCVKRKGRPKCVCAPECGAALRRKQQQEQQWGKTQRGSRSLSSEITNINLDINGPKRQRKHSDIADNQRKSEQENSMPMPMPMPQRQSHKKAMGETKHRRLLIIDSSSSSSSSGSSSNGRVEMRGYETRRRHRNNHGKHLTRSMMTGANDSTPAHQTTQSRHKLANANEPANDINRQQQPRRRNNNNNNSNSNKKHNKDQRIRIVAGTSAAATATAAAATTLLTVNTTMSVSGSGPHRRRLYQNEHGSEMAASSAQGNHGQSHSHLANADDLAFLGGIYEPVVLQQQQQHSNPVCGSDGRTYNTECQLRKRACRSNNAQLEVAYRGHCKTSCHGVQCLNGLMCVEDQYMMPHCISCNIECPRHNENRNDNDDDDDELDLDGYGYDGDYDEERAVCGVDGKTYRSACDINRMICKIGRSIAVAYPGPCRADRVTCADIKCGPKDTCLVDLQTQMPRCVSCRYKCSRKRQQQNVQVQVDKICGFNNHTYNSWCEMRKDSCATGYFIGVKAQGSC